MQQFIYAFISIVSFYVQGVHLSTSNASRFQFTEEARAALCPFVGTEGLSCFDEDPMKNSKGRWSPIYLKLRRGVGMRAPRGMGWDKLFVPWANATYPIPSHGIR